jgi:hypothetical protein
VPAISSHRFAAASLDLDAELAIAGRADIGDLTAHAACQEVTADAWVFLLDAAPIAFFVFLCNPDLAAAD